GGGVPAPGLARATEVVHVEGGGIARQQRPIDVEECCDGHGRGLYPRSTTMAMPCPPPMHSDATPRRASRAAMAWSRVTRTRAPLAPIGCPSAMAPPFTLTRFLGSFSSPCTPIHFPSTHPFTSHTPISSF